MSRRVVYCALIHGLGNTLCTPGHAKDGDAEDITCSVLAEVSLLVPAICASLPTLTRPTKIWGELHSGSACALRLSSRVKRSNSGGKICARSWVQSPVHPSLFVAPGSLSTFSSTRPDTLVFLDLCSIHRAGVSADEVVPSLHSIHS